MGDSLEDEETMTPCSMPLLSMPYTYPGAYAGAGRRTAAESRGSLRPTVAPREQRRRGREGRGPRGTSVSLPGAGRRAGGSLAQGRDRVRQALLGACAFSPEAGARCGSAACRERCGGCRVTGIPTATIRSTEVERRHATPLVIGKIAAAPYATPRASATR
jgi:hypothetical protein